MITEGTVTALDGANATVLVIQRSACAGCGGGCANCHKAVSHFVTVINSIDACVGDKVYIESKRSVIYAICTVLFIIPLIIAFAVYALFWGSAESGVGAFVLLLTALTSFAVLYLTVGKKLLKRNKYKMVKIY